MSSPSLYQQLILDHNRSPKNFKKLAAPTHHAEGLNPLCGDQYEIDLIIDENNVIQDIGFLGKGCAISKASASLMTAAVKGKSTAEAEKLFQSFRDLLTHQLKDNEAHVFELLGKLRIFEGIWQYPARVKCAGLAWHALHAALKNQQTISTE